MSDLEFKGTRTDQHGVTGAVFGPPGIDFPFRQQPTARELVDDLQQAAGYTIAPASETRLGPLNPHDVEEAMRPYLGEVWEAEQDDRAMGSHPTRLERAYRAALDHLLTLNGVHR